MQRRTFLAAGTSVLVTGGRGAVAAAATDAPPEFAEIEARSGGRLGVYAREIGTGRALTHRAGERFAMCSTFKMLAVAAMLQRVDRGREHLARRIAYGRADLQPYGPVTAAHVDEGSMTVEALCAAAIVRSDNTAANLLLRALGGPAAVTAFVRARPFHDPATRLDRIEPALNTALPGDPRDTTTPARMANALAILCTTHDAITAASAHRLEGWMRACATGTTALRAGFPAGWVAGDKTGSGANGTRNDVAIVRPPHRPPIVVAAYLTGASRIGDGRRNAALARVGRIVAAAFA